MSRNEIKIRRQRANATGAERYRNYATILAKHQRDVRMKRLTRFLWISVLAIVVFIIALFLIYLLLTGNKGATHSAMYVQDLPLKL